jgi:hypothetical protein
MLVVIFATQINVLSMWQNIPNYVDGTFQLALEEKHIFCEKFLQLNFSHKQHL